MSVKLKLILLFCQLDINLSTLTFSARFSSNCYSAMSVSDLKEKTGCRRKLFTVMSVILALAATQRTLCVFGLRYKLQSDAVQQHMKSSLLGQKLLRSRTCIEYIFGLRPKHCSLTTFSLLSLLHLNEPQYFVLVHGGLCIKFNGG